MLMIYCITLAVGSGKFFSKCTSLFYLVLIIYSIKYYFGVFILYLNIIEIEYLLHFQKKKKISFLLFPFLFKTLKYSLQISKVSSSLIQPMTFSINQITGLILSNHFSFASNQVHHCGKIYKESYQLVICCDLFMLHNVVGTIAIHVYLKMDKPLNCSVRLVGEHPWF